MISALAPHFGQCGWVAGVVGGAARLGTGVFCYARAFRGALGSRLGAGRMGQQMKYSEPKLKMFAPNPVRPDQFFHRVTDIK